MPKQQIRTIALALGLACTSAGAAPYTPASDSEVVERLPASATDPSVRRVESLRKQLAARPNDTGLRLEIARRYFDLAMAQGDPRYVGYAQAAIGPLAQSAAGNAGYWLVRGMILQYSHDFEGGLQSLQKAGELDPRSPEPVAWRAAIHMVQARYPEASAECERLVPLAHPLVAQGCTSYVLATTGHLAQAYEALGRQLNASGAPAPELVLWAQTRLADMAMRLQRPGEAETHFKEAFRQGVTDQYLLGAYSDFLLQQKRPS